MQVKVRDVFLKAYFVHCFTYQLNLIIQKTAKQNAKARILFVNFGYPWFFLTSHRTSVLESCVYKFILVVDQLNRLSSLELNAVYGEQDALKELLSASETASSATINGTSDLLSYLENAELCFWLHFFC